MHCVFFLSISIFTFCNSYVWVPQLSLEWKDGSKNHYRKGVKYAEDAGKPKNVEDLDILSEEQQSVELFRDKQGTHEQLSQNMKTVVDHPGNDTVKMCTIFE